MSAFPQTGIQVWWKRFLEQVIHSRNEVFEGVKQAKILEDKGNAGILA